jgi:hypothetical protein
LGFLSFSDSESDEESDDCELEEEEFELDPDDDLSDGDRVDFLFFCISFIEDTIDLIFSTLGEIGVIFLADCDGGGEGDFRLGFNIGCS